MFGRERIHGVYCLLLQPILTNRSPCANVSVWTAYLFGPQERWLQPGTEYAQHAEPRPDTAADEQNSARVAMGAEAGTAGANYELGIRRDYKVRILSRPSDNRRT